MYRTYRVTIVTQPIEPTVLVEPQKLLSPKLEIAPNLDNDVKPVLGAVSSVSVDIRRFERQLRPRPSVKEEQGNSGNSASASSQSKSDPIPDKAVKREVRSESSEIPMREPSRPIHKNPMEPVQPKLEAGVNLLLLQPKKPATLKRKYICKACHNPDAVHFKDVNRWFNKVDDLQRHVELAHTGRVDLLPEPPKNYRKFICQEPECGVEVSRREQLVNHLQITHNITGYEPTQMNFESFQQFEDWKSGVEKRTKILLGRPKSSANKMGPLRGRRPLKPNIHIFRCPRDNEKCKSSKKKKDAILPLVKLKKKRASCTAFLRAEVQEDSTVVVTGCLEHYGHSLKRDKKRTFLPVVIKDEIVRLLKEGVETNAIVQRIHDKAWSNEEHTTIARSLTKRNIYYVKRYNINKHDPRWKAQMEADNSDLSCASAHNGECSSSDDEEDEPVSSGSVSQVELIKRAVEKMKADNTRDSRALIRQLYDVANAYGPVADSVLVAPVQGTVNEPVLDASVETETKSSRKRKPRGPDSYKRVRSCRKKSE